MDYGYADVTQDDGVLRVREFHEAFNCVITPEPWMPELSAEDRAVVRHYASELGKMAKQLKHQAGASNEGGRAALGLLLIRLQLIVEETGELAEAWDHQDLTEALDALTDISYVVCGTYLTHGLQDLKVAADEEVHRSNLSKLGEDGKPIFSVAGRVEKGPNYSPPDLRSLLQPYLDKQRVTPIPDNENNS